jgi:hypothetical protein
MTPADFQQQDIRIYASIVGIDTVIVAPVQSFGDYNYDQIEWNRRLVEIYGEPFSPQIHLNHWRDRVSGLQEVEARATGLIVYVPLKPIW